MKPKRFFFQLIILLLIVVFSAPLSAAADNDSCEPMSWLPLLLRNGTASVTVTFSGKASIPNYTPAGQLWLVVDGIDGNRYGAGPSDAAGNFSINAVIPQDLQTVLLYAVDPNNPDAYVKAYIDLDESIRVTPQSHPASKNGSQSSKLPKEFISINLEDDFGKAMIRDLTGHIPADFTPEEFVALETLNSAFEAGYSPRLNTVVNNQSVVDSLSNLLENISAPAIRHYFDGYVNISGDLITRVRRLQQYVTYSVLPANKLSTYTWFLNTGPASPLISAGHVLKYFARRTYVDLLGYIPGASDANINYSDLEKAVAVFVNFDGIGAGNCEQHGLIGAYLASRFCEFKQIIRVALDVPSFVIPGSKTKHAVAIACQQSIQKSGFDLKELIHVINGEPWPDKLFTSDCILIDSWANVTAPITRELVEQQQWFSTEAVLKVNLPEGHCSSNSVKMSAGQVPAHKTNSNSMEVPSAQALLHNTVNSCPVNAPCKDCPTREEVASVLIEPFEIPPATDDYVVWYMDNVRCWDAPRVYATHRNGFNREELTCNIPGGGIDCSIPVEKKALGAGFTTQKEAEDWFCSQITTRWYHYWCNNRGPRVETGGGSLWTLQIPCDLSGLPITYP